MFACIPKVHVRKNTSMHILSYEFHLILATT
jgi:hypothetical protein